MEADIHYEDLEYSSEAIVDLHGYTKSTVISIKPYTLENACVEILGMEFTTYRGFDIFDVLDIIDYIFKIDFNVTDLGMINTISNSLHNQYTYIPLYQLHAIVVSLQLALNKDLNSYSIELYDSIEYFGKYLTYSNVKMYHNKNISELNLIVNMRQYIKD